MMFIFDNGKFQGVQEEEEKNPERVNINLINMIITLSLQVFFFKLQLQSRYVPCSLNKDFARPKLIAFILIQRFFFFFIVNCNDENKNFRTTCWAMNNFVFPADRSVCDI